jgi:hypothetical protein
LFNQFAPLVLVKSATSASHSLRGISVALAQADELPTINLQRSD